MLGAQDPSPGGACLPLCGSTWGSLQWVWKHRPPEWVSSPNGLSARLTHILRLQITNLTERGEFGLVFKNHHFHSTSQAANHKYSWHRSKPGGGVGGARGPQVSAAPHHAHRRPRLPPPFCGRSTHVNVMAPSRQLSLKRSRNVPGCWSLSSARSRSLLIKPTMHLRAESQQAPLASAVLLAFT